MFQLLFVLASVVQAEFLYKKDPNQQVCRAVALSGGGSKGAYEVGVLYNLSRELNETERAYDVYSGTSIGTLNAAILSLFEKGDELNQTEYLKWYWFHVKKSYGTWPGFEPYEALFKRPSLLNNAPLYANVEAEYKKFGYKIRRNMLVTATDLESGQEMTFDFEHLKEEEYTNATVASTAIPVLFPWTELRGLKLVDGGTGGWNTNMIGGINKCLEIVDDESKIELDVILLNPVAGPKYDNKSKSAINNFLRAREIKDYYKNMNDVAEFMRAHPSVKYRYLFQPDQTLETFKDIISFDNSVTQKMIDIGAQNAREVIAMGPGESFRRFQQSNNLGAKSRSSLNSPEE